MAAGFETTSTALAYSTYILATKPDIQKKLQAEIDEYQGKEIDYDLVTNMVYMNLFIQEVLRMFPISAIANNRWCNETTTVCGHQIDKGEYPLIFIYKKKTCFIRFWRECHSTRYTFYSLQLWFMGSWWSQSVCTWTTQHRTTSSGLIGFRCRITCMYWNAIRLDGNENVFGSFASQLHSVAGWAFGTGFQYHGSICYTARCHQCEARRTSSTESNRDIKWLFGMNCVYRVFQSWRISKFFFRFVFWYATGATWIYPSFCYFLFLLRCIFYFLFYYI